MPSGPDLSSHFSHRTGLLIVPLACFLVVGCEAQSNRALPQSAVTPVGYAPEAEAKVVAFCSACHVMPPAESFPRDAWHHEVMRGYEFYVQSGRKDLDPPPPKEAIAYYRSRAPKELDLKAILDSAKAAAPPMKVEEIARVQTNDPVPPGLAFLATGGILAEEKSKIYAADMRRGEILELETGKEPEWTVRYRGLRNPCHLEATDLDNDGKRDAVIADLGSYNPEDHAFGRVLWLRSREEGRYSIAELLSGVGRIADARPGDFNGDGILDLVVAEFGWQKTGAIWLLTQTTLDNQGRPELDKKKLLEIHGTSHVPVGDFDGDGKLDFVALISQEHERIVLFRNLGDGNFEQKVLWRAPDPAFGLSGIEVVDLDKDGDLDCLFTSGDTFDSPYLKPSHGIHWLENRGDDGFAYQRIAHLLAAYSAKAGDLDGDGDLDLIASCWAPRELPSGIDPATMPAVVCGMQTVKGEFEMSVLHRGAPRYVALALSDLDADGDLDIAAGSHLVNLQNSPHGGLLFLNQFKSQSKTTGKAAE